MRKLLQVVKANLVMLMNAGSLVGTTVVTSVLGFAYWWFAARLFTPEAVGLASAMISAMTLLGTIGVLGFGTLLTGELPRQPGKEGSLISVSLIVVGGAGLLLGCIFAVVAPYLARDFQVPGASGLNLVIFASGVSLTTITLVLDQALIGLLRGGLQLLRNTLFSAAKLAVLVAVGFFLQPLTGMTIYTTWLIGNALSLVALVVFIPLRKRGWREICLPQWGVLRKLSGSAVQHHILNLILLAPPLVLPILVTIQLSVTANAWFYVSFMLANFIFTLTYALSTVLYAEGAARPDALAHKARFTLGIAFVTSIAANCVLQFGAPLVLGVFGHIYAEQAAWSLRILSLAVFPLIIISHYIAICRIQNRITQAILPITLGTLIELVGAVLGAHWLGLVGLSTGWLVGLSLEALCMLPRVYRATRPVDVAATDKQEELVEASTF